MKMGEVKLSRYALVRPIKTSFSFSSKPKLPILSYGHGEKNKGKNNPSQFSDELLSDRIVRSERPRAKSSDSRDYGFCGAYQPSTSDLSGSVMQTLDRKISASSDQLDSLKKMKYCEQPRRARSSSRVSCEGNYQENKKVTSELSEYKYYKADPNMKMSEESIHKTSQRKGSRQGRADWVRFKISESVYLSASSFRLFQDENKKRKDGQNKTCNHNYLMKYTTFQIQKRM